MVFLVRSGYTHQKGKIYAFPHSDLQIWRAKPDAKQYSITNGIGLSLIVEPNGYIAWRFRYRFAGKAM